MITSLWAALVLLGMGCHNRTPALVDQAEAISIACMEVEKRGWREYSVKSAVFTNGSWVIHLEILPIRYGGFALVEISTNRQVSYLPGL